MKAKFLRLFSILTLCGLFFGFSACQTEGGDEDSSSKKTEETKTEETKNDGTKTDDTQTGGQNTQTGKYKITYKLSYEIDKNTVPSSSTYKTIYFDEPYTITEDDLAIPEPKSYMTGEEWVFDGWWNQGSSISTKLTPGEIIDTSITVSGFWRTRLFGELHYDSKYDSEHCPENINIKENEVLTEENLPELSCEGHNFKGWWTTIYSDGKSKEIPVTPGFRTPISGNFNIYLTAKWDQTVSFSTEYGTAPEAISVPTGTSFKKLAEMLTEDTYILTDEADAWGFAGWECKTSSSCGSQLLTPDNENLSSYWIYYIDEDITLTARWVREKYIITFVTELGTAPEAIKVATESKYSDLNAILQSDAVYSLHDENFSFSGWYTSWFDGDRKIENCGDAIITTDIQLTAKWEAKVFSYTVKHFRQNLDDDEYTEFESEELTGTYGEKTKAIPKEYEHFTVLPFEQKTISSSESRDIRIYYDRKKYTITFDTQGGGEISQQLIKYQGKIVKPDAPEKTGFEFKDWCTIYYDRIGEHDIKCFSIDGFDFDSEVSSDMTLCAKWILRCSTDNDEIFTKVRAISGPCVIKLIANDATDVDIYNAIGWIDGNVGAVYRSGGGYSAFGYELDLSETNWGYVHNAFQINAYVTNIIFPDTLYGMYEYTFDYISLLKRLIIPDSVYSIPVGCFDYCRKLELVSLPADLNYLHGFSNCISLQTIIFRGTVEQWNKLLEKSESMFKEALAETVICSDGEVPIKK